MQLLRSDTKRERQESVYQEAQGFVPTVHIPTRLAVAVRKICGAAFKKKKKKSGQIPSRMSRWGGWGDWQHPGRGWGKWVGQPDTFHGPSSSLAFLQLSTTRPLPPPPSILSAFCPPRLDDHFVYADGGGRAGQDGKRLRPLSFWLSLLTLRILQTKTIKKKNPRRVSAVGYLNVLLLVFNTPLAAPHTHTHTYCQLVGLVNCWIVFFFVLFFAIVTFFLESWAQFYVRAQRSKVTR